jgi:methyl-accepting chemotaxis protein
MSTRHTQEITLKKETVLLSTTDLSSRITYANEAFCDVSGFSTAEMYGQPHNLVRHNDMPKAAFANMWETIQAGNSWMGPVKNKSKDGRFYWVNAFVTPIKNEQGKIIEYQSVRTHLDDQVKKRAQREYQKIQAGQVANRYYDSTKWISYGLIASCLIALIVSVFTLSPAILALAILLMLTSYMQLRWRKRYLYTLKEAKEAYDNPLMSFLYSGHNDAVGSLSLAIKMQQAKVRAVVGRVNDESLRVNINAQKNTQSGQQVSELLKKQNNEVQQMVQCMQDFTVTIEELNTNVERASRAAMASEQHTQDGKSSVDKVIDAIHHLDEHLAEVNQAVSRLVAGNEKIHGILNVINSIAEQTNLLALNAAIEAARAGDHGRGFSVVADEVRALAQKTQASTEEITQLVQELNDVSQSAVSSMDQGNLLSNTSVELASKNGESLSTIQSHVTELADLNRSVAAAIEQQSVVIKQINLNVESVSELADLGGQHGQHSHNLSQELLSQIEQQTKLIQQFC